METCDLDYQLEPELIAQQPCEVRDHSGLLVLDRGGGGIEHRRFCDIEEILRSGDCLVLNDTRVIPARLMLLKSTGGRLEGLFLRELEDGRWQVLLDKPGKLGPGAVLTAEKDDQVTLTVIDQLDDGSWRLEASGETAGGAMELLGRIGSVPLPRYIRGRGRHDGGAQQSQQSDRLRYQTVYAAVDGAVAAPTAGLHFTAALLERLDQIGIKQVRVTLHVGLGTFRPVRTRRLGDHQMHSEWYHVSDRAVRTIESARSAGGRIVAVGTTCARVLETVGRNGKLCSGQGFTDLFIYPPYRFRYVDALITNFHLPGSTLLAMVFAFASRDLVLGAYQEAISRRYRFYSYGDAMLIL